MLFPRGERKETEDAEEGGKPDASHRRTDEDVRPHMVLPGEDVRPHMVLAGEDVCPHMVYPHLTVYGIRRIQTEAAV